MAISLTLLQKETLGAIYDTFLASLTPDETDELRRLCKRYPTITENDIHTMATTTCQNLSAQFDPVDGTLQLLQRTMTYDKQQGFLRLLSLLSSSIGMAILTQGRHRKPMAELPRQDREKVFLQWQHSRFQLFRSLFGSFAALTWAMSYIRAEAQDTLHRTMGYPTYDPVRSQSDYLPPYIRARLPMFTQSVLEEKEQPQQYDVIIVGSGSGGSVVAAVAAKAGYSVLVIEKGPYYHESDFVLQDGQAAQRNLERGGAFLSDNGTLAVLSGSLIGGSNTINYSASFRLPHYVRAEWAKLGLSYFTSVKFNRHLDEVCERIGVTTEGISMYGSNRILTEGCKNLGYHHDAIPQNSGGHPHNDHWCSTGCRDGVKNGSMNTWLRDVVDNGGKIMDNTKVDSVLRNKQGEAIGVGCTITGKDGKKYKKTIYGRRVVVSGGTLQSPGVLLRSGLKNKHIGEHLRVHTCVITLGYFDEVVDAYKGTMMTAYSDVVADNDHQHYGAKIEGVSHHATTVANATLWRGSLDHKYAMLRYRYSAPLLTVTRDKDSYGKVYYEETMEGDSLVQVHYDMSKHDQQSVVAGIVASAKILVAAGAREIRTMQYTVPPFVFKQDEEILVDHPRFMDWLACHVEKAGPPPIVSTPHEMGTCRIGVSPKTSVCKPTGETWEANNLFVADASLFPTTSGVNPMVTIMALCLHIGEEVVKSLQDRPAAKL